MIKSSDSPDTATARELRADPGRRSSTGRRSGAGPEVASAIERPSRRSTVAAWLFALVLLVMVVGVVVHLTELEELAGLLQHVQMVWLLGAVALQILTYVCAAAVWHVALAREGWPAGIRSLVPVALAMLFTNQAFPSAGLSGSVTVLQALRKRHIPANAIIGALLVGLMTTYAAFVIAILISLVLLRVYHAVNVAWLVVTAMFALAASGVPAVVVWYRRSIAPRLQTRLSRIAGVGPLLDAIRMVPTGLLNDREVLMRAVALQLAEIVLDAATLQVMLAAIGVFVKPTAVFASFVMASAISQVVPVPLGLGSFEAALIAMLHLTGVSLEAALTATLMLRGFTLWLPMLPGLWCARNAV